MNRRAALSILAAGTVGVATAGAGTRAPIIIIIGAGVAGLAAAREIARAGLAVTLLEARERIGGRIHTDRRFGFACDLGAGWIHGPGGGNPIAALAAEAKAATFVTEDDSVRVYDTAGRDVSARQFGARGDERAHALLRAVEDGVDEEHDRSLWAALAAADRAALADPYVLYPLTAYTEFDAGGPLEELSAAHWADDEKFPGKDVIIPSGYDAVPGLLARAATARGAQLHLNAIVEAIDHRGDRVIVRTGAGSFDGRAAICTVPLGVLRTGDVRFTPPLPDEHRNAIARLGVGGVNKVFCSFETAFWRTDVQYFGYHAPERGMFAYCMNYRAFSSVPCLVGICMGKAGRRIDALSDADVSREATRALRAMFGAAVPAPKASSASRWNADPYARGSYSFAAVGTSRATYARLAKPAGPRLFLAGEHTSEAYRATVHGAYLSGLRAAREAIAAVAGPA